MQHRKSSISRSKRQQAKRDERGIALITTLLLLMLLSGLTLAMAWSARSDLLINGYYRNFRGSFYAADSGVSIMRQALFDELSAGGGAYPATFAKGTNPLPSPATETKIMSDINGTYGSKTLTGSGTGSAAKSWPEQYGANITVVLTACSATGGVDCFPPKPFPGTATDATYTYSYTITSTGKSQGNENTVLTDTGQLQVVATIPTVGALNFAGYGMFIDSQTECSGGTLVAGKITGPVFTNGGWTFGNSGTYTFTDPVGQADAQAGFSASSCVTAAASSGNGISPTFQQGFQLGQTKIPLPQNSFQQAQAVIDGIGASGAGQPTPASMNPVLKDVTKTAYPSNKIPTSGVFLPYTVNALGVPTGFTGGGIMVEGDASIVLAPSGTAAQTYTITQGGTVTTITIDPTGTGTTTMTSGAKTVIIPGVPHQMDSAGNIINPYETMLFVDGNITSLSGPGQGKTAIQDGTAITITAGSNATVPAAANVTITGDLLYNKEPVYGAPSLPGTAAQLDQLTGFDTKQALGIFTAKGDIQLANAQSNKLLEIDASLATLSQGGTGGLVNNGNAIDTLTIVGGRIQNNIKNINTTTRNVLFDRRFANGFAPPWFPSTGVQPPNNGGKLNAPVLTRLQWFNKNSIY